MKLDFDPLLKDKACPYKVVDEIPGFGMMTFVGWIRVISLLREGGQINPNENVRYLNITSQGIDIITELNHKEKKNGS